MKITFSKYQGTGNDFILIDNRQQNIRLRTEQIKSLCERRFGIGADGLMLLETEEGADFKMIYFNADGNESTMCGNGGRCITAFARKLGIIHDRAFFTAIDGRHEALLEEADFVRLQMTDVTDIENRNDHSLLNTGSPHYVLWVDDVTKTDVYAEGRTIRNRQDFQPKGINVNFAQREEDRILVRTYERGEEEETLSCGTGVTAVAIASVKNKTGDFSINIETPGGLLNVSFHKAQAKSAERIWLSGAAMFVFEGRIAL